MKKLANKISFTVISLLLVGISSSGIGGFLRTRRTFQLEIQKQYVENHLTSLASNITQELNRAVNTSLQLASDPSVILWVEDGEIDTFLGELINKKLAQLVNKYNYITSFIVSEPSGNYWAKGTLLKQLSSTNPEDQWFYENLKMNGNFQLNIDYNPDLGDSFVFVNALVSNDTGPIGIAGVGLKLNDVINSLQQSKLSAGSTVYLFNQSGDILISSSETEIKKIDLIAGDDFVISNQGQLTIKSNNELFIFAWESLGDTGYYIANYIPVSELYDFINGILYFSIIVILIAIVLSGLIIIILISKSVKPLIDIKDALFEISHGEGDLTKRLETVGKDEIADVANNFNLFLNKLRSMIEEIQNTVLETDKVKNNIANSTEETTSSIEEINANIQSIDKQLNNLNDKINGYASAIEEIDANTNSFDTQISNQTDKIGDSTSAITQMMASLSNVAKISKAKRGMAIELGEIVHNSQDKIDITVNMFNKMVNNIKGIQEMVTAINQISSQTNLLSMNAAIEAAHAGESGKGFSVVAEEIRKLADSATISSKNISNMINEITTDVSNTDQYFQETNSAFEEIQNVVKSTVDAFTEIDASIEELNSGGEMILQSSESIQNITINIEKGSKEIKEGVSLLLIGMKEIREISNSVSNGANEVSTGSNEILESMQLLLEQGKVLNEIVLQLGDLSGKFQV